MASTVNFTAPNYHESQPFPIETSIVDSMAHDPRASAMMLPMLMSYQAQRGDSQAGYQDQIQQQHQMAMNALMQNQANNRQEQTISGLKAAADNPGVMSALLSNANTGPLYAGTSGSSLNSINDNANRIALSKILQSTGKGVEGMAMGGMQPSPASIGGVTGLPMAPYTPPVAQAAGINAAGREGAATISANGAGIPRYNIPIPASSDSGVPIGTTISTRGLPGETPQQTVQRVTPQTHATSGAAVTATGPVTQDNWQQLKTVNPTRYYTIQSAAATGKVGHDGSGVLTDPTGKPY